MRPARIWLLTLLTALLLCAMGNQARVRADPPRERPEEQPGERPADAPIEASVPVRVGEHPGFGRIVFDFTRPVVWHLVRDGDTVSLRFDPGQAIGPPPALPRNVLTMTSGMGRAEITVAAGARLRTMPVQDRLVLDVLDPVPARPLPGALAVLPASPIDRHDPAPATLAEFVAPRLPGRPPLLRRPPRLLQVLAMRQQRVRRPDR